MTQDNDGGPDGIAGTDNVKVLFPDKPSAVPPGPQPDIVQMLESLATEAATGKITGLMVISFNEVGGHNGSLTGKIPFGYGIAALEQMKFGIMARDYGNNAASR